MLKDNNACIRYLMKELDPSEEMLMERRMMEDDDLLIEVEGMRQTYKRLDELPEMDPPDDVRDSVLKKAQSHAREQQNKHSGLRSVGDLRYIAAAATILVAASIGGIWMFYDVQGEEGTDVAGSAASASSILSQINQLDEEAQPWVDKDDVIYFQDRFNNQADFDSILNSSTQKLKPIEESLFNNQSNRSLQLTGSGQ